MFWDAVLGGLRMFLHWATYVAMLEALLIMLIPLALHKSLWRKTLIATGMARATGIASMVLLAFIQTFAMAVFVLTLAPLILGLQDHAAWSLPWSLLLASPVSAIVFLAFATLVSALMGFIPVVGRMQAMVGFVVGSLSLMAMVLIVTEGTAIEGQVRLLPDFWFGLALVAVGAALALVGTFAISGVAALMDQVWDGVGGWLCLPLALPFALLPVFIYGAWLAEQIHAG